MYYIYRFLNRDGEVIYIGYTNSLKSRMSSHFSNEGHLDKRCYAEVDTIEYIKVKSSAEARIIEATLIGIVNPKYNSDYINYKPEKINFEVSLCEWKILSRYKHICKSKNIRRKENGLMEIVLEYNKDLSTDICLNLNKNIDVNSLFKDRSTREIKFIFYILTFIQYNIVDTNNVYSEYTIFIKNKGVHNFKELYGKHIKEFYFMLDKGISIEYKGREVFCVSKLENNYIINVNSKFFIGRDLTKINLYDVLSIKNLPSMYIYVLSMLNLNNNLKSSFSFYKQDVSNLFNIGSRYKQFIEVGAKVPNNKSVNVACDSNRMYVDLEFSSDINNYRYQHKDKNVKTVMEVLNND